MFRLFIRTPSAEEAVNAYEPILRFDAPPERVTEPIALFFASVKLVAASVSALPLTDPLEAVDADVSPCKLLVLPVKIPVTFVKTAVDLTSAIKDKTRVVFAGTM